MCQLWYLICPLVCIFIFVPHIESVLRYQAERYNGGFEEGTSSILCLCGNGTQLVKSSFDSNMVKAMVSENLSYKSCIRNHRKDVCDLLRFCTKCVVSLKRCFKSTEEEKSYCIKERYHMRKKYFKTKQWTDLDVFPGELSRGKRNAGYCAHPSGMKTADLACISKYKMVSCAQKCIYGHTLARGPIQTLTCRKDENKWKPHGFKECKPFLDCTINLVSGGSVSCTTGTTTSSNVCLVGCYPYEEKLAVRKNKYECKLDGSWSPKLPFCAKKGSALYLVPAPRNY